MPPRFDGGGGGGEEGAGARPGGRPAARRSQVRLHGGMGIRARPARRVGVYGRASRPCGWVAALRWRSACGLRRERQLPQNDISRRQQSTFVPPRDAELAVAAGAVVDPRVTKKRAPWGRKREERNLCLELSGQISDSPLIIHCGLGDSGHCRGEMTTVSWHG